MFLCLKLINDLLYLLDGEQLILNIMSVFTAQQQCRLNKNVPSSDTEGNIGITIEKIPLNYSILH